MLNDKSVLITGGVKVDPDFSYRSDNNSEWMTIDTLRDWLDRYRNKIGPV